MIKVAKDLGNKIILCDFDDTLSHFEGVPPAKPGAPLEGVLEYLPKLKKAGWQIHIFSGRANYSEGIQQIAEWMDSFNLPYDAILLGKPDYEVIIDDSSISPKYHSWKDMFEQVTNGEVGIHSTASAPGSKDFDYSSIQVALPKEIADKLIQWGKDNIPNDILSKDEGDGGRESYPHVTLKYGIHDEDPEESLNLLVGEKSFKIKLGQISLFESKDKPFDVVKVEIESPELHRLNKKVSDNLEVTDTFPEYKPHATIAYIKKGTGSKFKGNKDLAGTEVKVSELEFSSKDKEKGATPIKLQTTKEAAISKQSRQITLYRGAEFTNEDQVGFWDNFIFLSNDPNYSMDYTRNSKGKKVGALYKVTIPDARLIPNKILYKWIKPETSAYSELHSHPEIINKIILAGYNLLIDPLEESYVLLKPSEQNITIKKIWQAGQETLPRGVRHELTPEELQEMDKLNMGVEQYFKHKGLNKEAQFYPSLVNAPSNRWGPDDVVIPTRPEWADVEETWHFPYKDRNVNWNETLPMVLVPDKKEAAGSALKQRKIPEPPRDWRYLHDWFSKYTFYSPKWISNLKSEKQAYAIAMRLYEESLGKKEPSKLREPIQLDLPGLEKSAEFSRADDIALSILQKRLEERDTEFGKKSCPERDSLVREITRLEDKLKANYREAGVQPATTWDGNEPFSPLPTQWELHTDDGLLDQQYYKQFKGLKTSPYWDNFNLMFQFLSESKYDEKEPLFKINDVGANFLILRKITANISLYQEAKALTTQLKETLKQVEDASDKAGYLLRAMEDQLDDLHYGDSDLETQERLGREVVQKTIEDIKALHPSMGPVVTPLERLLTPRLAKLATSDYSKSVIATSPTSFFIPKQLESFWQHQLQAELEDLDIDFDVYPASLGSSEGSLHGWTVEMGHGVTGLEDAFWELMDEFFTDHQVPLVRAEKVPLNQLVQDPADKLPEHAPETVQQVPTAHPKDVQKKRDELLDQMLQYPEGSPERKKWEDKLRAFGGLYKTAEVYTDKEMEDIYSKTRQDSGDHYGDSTGGGNVFHDWNQSTNDFPQPKDMDHGTSLERLVPRERIFNREVTPPTGSPADFLSMPFSDADEGLPYDNNPKRRDLFKKKKKSNLISPVELLAANLVDLIRVNVEDTSEDLDNIKGTVHLLNKVVPWSAKVINSDGHFRLYKLDISEVEKAINRTNLSAVAKRDQLDKVQERIRELLYAPKASLTYRNTPSTAQLDQLFDKLPSVWWSKTTPPKLHLKDEATRDMLLRSKFDPGYFLTFPAGRTDKYSWTLIDGTLLVLKNQ